MNRLKLNAIFLKKKIMFYVNLKKQIFLFLYKLEIKSLIMRHFSGIFIFTKCRHLHFLLLFMKKDLLNKGRKGDLGKKFFFMIF